MAKIHKCYGKYKIANRYQEVMCIQRTLETAVVSPLWAKVTCQNCKKHRPKKAGVKG